MLIRVCDKIIGFLRLDKINERIGRLEERCHGIAQHYTINLITDETGKKAASLTWEKNPVANSMLTHPGVYCLRSNETSWDEATLWHTYTFKQRNGSTLHIRKATIAEPTLQELYKKLRISSAPGEVKKLIS